LLLQEKNKSKQRNQAGFFFMFIKTIKDRECCTYENTRLKISVKTPGIGVNLQDEDRSGTAELSYWQF
jgi:hypothetical protein